MRSLTANFLIAMGMARQRGLAVADSPVTVRNLARRFRIVGLLLVCVGAAVLSYGYHLLADSELVRIGKHANEGTAQHLLAAVQAQVGNRLWQTEGRLTREAEPRRFAQFHASMVTLLRHTTVQKVKIYDPAGAVVYSTQLSQVGDQQGKNPAVLGAFQGVAVSVLVYRDRFDAVERQVFERDLLSSYIPARDAAGQVLAVFEIYDDMTPLLAAIRATQWRITALVVTVLLAVYLALDAIARRVLRVIEGQQAGLRASGERLAAAKQVAEHASQAKSSFLANMSHEIRTPMNGVLGMAELLSATSLNDVQRKYVKTLRRSGRSLMALLNDILDLSRVEIGRLELEVRCIDLRRVLQSCIDLMGPRASPKGLTLELAIGAELHTVVLGDPLRLQQVLNNLLGNAIKFTETGKISLSLALDSDAPDAPRYRFEVADTGPGIAQQALARLFEPFTQADSSTARKHGGSGLGLAISKRIVEAMGGVLTVKSSPGAGSVFGFSIALRSASALPAGEESFSSVSPADTLNHGEESIGALNLLLVEDNQVNQIYCQALLEQMGHRVQLASDGEEAVRMAENSNFDMILMDCHMPVLDGFEATARIRELESRHYQSRRLIVALTASAMPQDQLRCKECGMDDVLTKPFTREELRALLRRNVAVPA